MIICRNFIKLLVSRDLCRFSHLRLLRLSSHSLRRCIGIHIRLKATGKATLSGLMMRISEAKRLRRRLSKIILDTNDYGVLHGRLVEAEKAGKKGFAEGGKWYWLSNKGDYIGRKPAKTFGSGRP